jgi:hypothetical protein
MGIQNADGTKANRKYGGGGTDKRANSNGPRAAYGGWQGVGGAPQAVAGNEDIAATDPLRLVATMFGPEPAAK